MVLPRAPGVWVLTEPEPPSWGWARAGTWGGTAFLPAPPAPAFWPCFGSSLSPPSLGIASWVEGAVAAAWAPCEPAATRAWGPRQSPQPSPLAREGPRGGRGEVEVSQSSTQPGNLLPVCGGDTTSSLGAARLLHWALPSRATGGACGDPGSPSLAGRPSWVLACTSLPGALASGAGAAASLDPAGRHCAREQGFIAALGLAIANASPRLMRDPVPPWRSQHPRDQAFLARGKGDFMVRRECAVQGVKNSTVGEIPAVYVHSDAIGTKGEQTISEERINIKPTSEEYFRSLSVAWLLGEPYQSPGAGGQGRIKPFCI